VGHSYSKTITASGGTSPYSFIVISGSLPPGLTLASGGALSGTPASPGSFTFEIEARDHNGCPGTRQYQLTVPSPTINVSPSTLPSGTLGQSYSKTITASGGHSPYSFTVSSGSLPPGLTLTSAGVLSGTPTLSGSFTCTIRANDSYGCPGTRQYDLAVVYPTISLNPSSLSNGTVGHSYSKTITASGGHAPYTFTVSSGSLPPGLTLTSAGILSGTPTSHGSLTFTIRANDSYGYPGTRQYQLTVP